MLFGFWSASTLPRAIGNARKEKADAAAARRPSPRCPAHLNLAVAWDTIADLIVSLSHGEIRARVSHRKPCTNAKFQLLSSGRTQLPPPDSHVGCK